MDQKITIQDNKTYVQVWSNTRVEVCKEIDGAELIIVDKRPDYE